MDPTCSETPTPESVFQVPAPHWCKKAISLYLSHNNTSEKNNSLNGFSKKPRIMVRRFTIPLVK